MKLPTAAKQSEQALASYAVTALAAAELLPPSSYGKMNANVGGLAAWKKK